MHFDQNKTIGALGTLIVAKWYRLQFPDSLLISLDSAETKRWMNLEEDSKRADLLGLSVVDGVPRIDILEAKSGVADATSVYTVDGGGHIRGKPIDQLQNTGKSIGAIFALNEWKTHLLTPPRREILRNHLYRQGLSNRQTSDKKLFWSKILNSMFSGELKPDVRLNLILVNLGLNEEPSDDVYETLSGVPVRLVYLNADTVNAHLKSEVERMKPAAYTEGDRPSYANQAETDGEDCAAGRLVSSSGAAGASRPSLEQGSRGGVAFGGVVDRAPSADEGMVDLSSKAEVSEELQLHVRSMCEKIKAACQDFSVRVVDIDPDKVDIGPSVLRYKIELAPGEDAGRLRKQAENIARQLAATSVPIIGFLPGTHFEYLDLPRPDRQVVRLEPILQGLVSNNVNELIIHIGVDPAGDRTDLDLSDDKLPHILVAGGTGSGKTIFLYSVVLSLVAAHSQDTLELVIIDPKQTDFTIFGQLPHLRDERIISDAQAGVDVIQDIADHEMQARSDRLQKAGYRDIKSYNSDNPKNLIKPLVIVIDEYADLVGVLTKKERERFEKVVSRLTARGRNVGIHLVLATQRPTVDTVTGNIKANMPCRISFSLPTGRDSSVILDEPGAERLLRNGDMLLLLEGRLKRLQGYYVEPKNVLLKLR